MFYADGTRYEGQWLNTKQHGRGTMYYANGNVYEVIFISVIYLVFLNCIHREIGWTAKNMDRVLRPSTCLRE